MKTLPGVDLLGLFQFLFHFHAKWMLATLAGGIIAVLLCVRFRHSRWIVPFWSLLLVTTGAHTGLIGLLSFDRSTDYAAVGAGFLAMISWPVTLTFVALLFAYPKKRKPQTPSV